MIDCIACLNTSSAILNAADIDMAGSDTRSSLSFGITINVSTSLASQFKPLFACCCRWCPSKGNGFVTTPTVKQPKSCLAIRATTGAPPVPVPPPIPAATNAKSVPASASRTSSALSSKQAIPNSGTPPTPIPFANLSPTRSRRCESANANACASVFVAMYSTPGIRLRYIRVTAFDPPPPTPTTLMLTVGVRRRVGFRVEVVNS